MQVHSATQTPQPSTLSETVIPAVRGEFYNYTATFTSERPLGYLMKCKANKDRPLHFAEEHADELDLVFLFESTVRICSPDSKLAIRLLVNVVDAKALSQTKIVAANISAERFQQLRLRKNGEMLAEVCSTVTAASDSVVTLTPGMIVAVVTESGKFGLMLIKEIKPDSVTVDACHILL